MEKSKILISHPTGNTFVRALLNECEEKDLLEKFFTTIGKGKNTNFILKNISNRRAYPIPDQKIYRQWFPEISRLLFGRYKTQKERKNDTDKVYEKLDRKVSENLEKLNVSCVHGYEDGAAHTFRRAKELGIRCSYELPIAHWATSRRLLGKEAERYPEWIPTLDSISENEEKLHRKEQELELADCISCPSEFVLQSLPENIRNAKPCQVAHFGSPDVSDSQIEKVDQKNNQKLKILFVGSMSQRKGLADLFNALKILNTHHVSLTIVGQPAMPISFYRAQHTDFKHIPSCSNDTVKSIMRSHDILILPSIVEGCALVQLEALSCGLPIMITRNTGGEDFIDEKETGFLVPTGNPEKIAEKIEWLICNRSILPKMKILSKNKSTKYKWEIYAKNILDYCK
ncbi:MAG: glycosyltransferase family 4 protein [Opitutae bacterium]|nr:glycosyltransferase family 4 protein [Opitutae bacterium]